MRIHGDWVCQGITVPCPYVDKDIGPINVVPFNPTLDETYDTIRESDD